MAVALETNLSDGLLVSAPLHAHLSRASCRGPATGPKVGRRLCGVVERRLAWLSALVLVLVRHLAHHQEGYRGAFCAVLCCVYSHSLLPLSAVMLQTQLTKVGHCHNLETAFDRSSSHGMPCCGLTSKPAASTLVISCTGSGDPAPARAGRNDVACASGALYCAALPSWPTTNGSPRLLMQGLPVLAAAVSNAGGLGELLGEPGFAAEALT